MKTTKAKGPRLNRFAAKLVVSLFPVLLLTGCATMEVTPLKTGEADSYTQHEQKAGVVFGVHPMTDKAEINGVFKTNLLEDGVLPILVVVENHNPSASFIIAKEKVFVRSGVIAAANTSPTDHVASGEDMAGKITSVGILLMSAPLVIASLKFGSDVSVIKYNIADKEFYSRTLQPGEKAQGFLYFQFPKQTPPSGDYHIVAEIKDSATGETTSFDFPVNLTLKE